MPQHAYMVVEATISALPLYAPIDIHVLMCTLYMAPPND